jgi:hypothetical protein
MNIRLTILSLSIPLFLLLVGLNGALLFDQETTEMKQALGDQAVAAAVTVSAFAATAPDPVRYLTQPARRASVQKATMEVTELKALYLVRSRTIVAHLIPASATIDAARLHAPAAPVALPIETNSAGRRVVAALAPVSPDMFIVSEVDAEPLYARIAALKRLLLLLLISAGVIGGGLALLVARRVTRELALNRAMIAAIARDAPPPPAPVLMIRETRDLAAAVGLMGASLAAGLERDRRAMIELDLLRDETASVAAYHQAAFAPVSWHSAGVTVEVRMLGDAPAGCFFALCKGHNGKHGALVMGECTASTPAAALAQALAARRFFEGHMGAGNTVKCVAIARDAFELARIVWLDWTDSETVTATRTLALLDDKSTQRAAAYVHQMGMLDPDALMGDLTALLPVCGVLAVLGRQRPVN